MLTIGTAALYTITTYYHWQYSIHKGGEKQTKKKISKFTNAALVQQPQKTVSFQSADSENFSRQGGWKKNFLT